MGRGRYGLPVDWEGCPKIGDGLVQDLFLTFKTPLTPALNFNVKKDGQFHLSDVFNELARLEKDNVLWIDLTNTERYYPRDEVIARKGYTYLKMPMLGHGNPPSKAERDGFNLAVDNFLAEYPTGSIAVHCTHGFNRTGYLISYYLMARKGLSAHDAMTEFKVKRPPGIYRKNYVEELYKLGIEESETPPGDRDPSFVPLEVTDPEWVSQGTKDRMDGNWRKGASAPTTNGSAWRGGGGSASRGGRGRGGSARGGGSRAAGCGGFRGGGRASSQPRSRFADDELVSNFNDNFDDEGDNYNDARSSYGATSNYSNPEWRNPNRNIWNNIPSSSNSDRFSWRNSDYQNQQFHGRHQPSLPPPPPQERGRRISHQFRGGPTAPPAPRLRQCSNWQYSRLTGQPIPFNGGQGYQNSIQHFSNPNLPPPNSRKRSYPNPGY